AGTVLGPEDAVRTGAGGRARLVSGQTVIEVEPGTDLAVAELSRDLARLLLGVGMVTADTQEGAGAVAIEVDGTDVATRAEDGRYTVASDGKGTVAVGASRGEVEVSAKGKAVVLRGGEETLVPPGEAPQSPRPAARSLLLRVAWPEKGETNKRRLVLRGRTRAGALVFVAGRPVVADAGGRFRVPLELREGPNRIDLRAKDVSGNEARPTTRRIVVDTRGAKAHFDTRDLWDD
ncbi:MAG: hypothetical protein D6729_14130, partial [Deltaproteobacteria bacterium]